MSVILRMRESEAAVFEAASKQAAVIRLSARYARGARFASTHLHPLLTEAVRGGISIIMLILLYMAQQQDSAAMICYARALSAERCCLFYAMI